MGAPQQVLFMASSSSSGNAWNPSDVASEITLSNSNRTALRSTTNSPAWRTVRSLTSHSTGKWYFEVLWENYNSGSPGGSIVGVAPSGLSLSAFVGSTSTSYGIQATNIPTIWVYNNGSNTTAGAGILSPSGVGDHTIMVAVDFDAGKIWFGTRGLWQTGSDPATGTAPHYTFSPNPTLYAALSENDNPTQLTSQFASGQLTHSPPSGFSAWN